MTSTETKTPAPGAEALERARTLARAIGESAVFKAFEAAQEALESDRVLNQRVGAFVAREQTLRASRAWGGADPEEEQALEKEWLDLTNQPVLAAFLARREALSALLQDVALAIGEGTGVDYGAACAPAGGCC